MKEKASKLWTLNTKDFIKGLVVAVITAVLTFLIEVLQTGGELDIEFLKKLGVVAAISFLSYLLKNLFTNSKDEIITSEPK